MAWSSSTPFFKSDLLFLMSFDSMYGHCQKNEATYMDQSSVCKTEHAGRQFAKQKFSSILLHQKTFMGISFFSKMSYSDI